ncbi:MAG: AraC family transcriptional regulator [Clostridia bacterium]|nr:AraC family transcriptional regulator [Clostridia bacterium]
MKILQARNFFKKELPFKPFYINSCGYFCDIDFDTKTERPLGRSDFQLICMTAGKMAIQLDGSECIMQKDNFYLFKPGEPQIYRCSKEDNSAYFWIHFNGTMAEEILRDNNLCDGNIHTYLSSKEDIRLIQKIISEINQKTSSYQISLLGLFSQLITRISRHTSDKEKKDLYAQLAPAISAMENVDKAYTVSEYAKMCNMSVYHFSHKFKTCTNQSPMQYQNKIAMNHAAYLLKSTDLSIGEISAVIGVSDPLYFSKKFKKAFGVSPTEYRS